jgi:hypothetical protein
MVRKPAQTLPGALIFMTTRTQPPEHMTGRVKGLPRSLQVRTTAPWGGSRGWCDRHGSRLAWSVEETVVALWHLLSHSQQERFTFARGLALIACFLLPR